MENKKTHKYMEQHTLNYWIKEKIQKKVKSISRTNKNYYITYQNLHYTAKALLRGKFIEINVYIKRRILNELIHFIPQETKKTTNQPTNQQTKTFCLRWQSR